MEQILPDIPRIYTAAAEWAACMVFILLLKPRLKKLQIAMVSIAVFLLQSFFLVATGDAKLFFWIPCMIIAVVIMVGFLYLCCDIRWLDAAYFTIEAFVTAEFAASLVIGLVVFTVSNLSFVTTKTPFSGQYGFDILTSGLS